MISLPEEFTKAKEIRILLRGDTHSEKCRIASFNDYHVVCEQGNSLFLCPWTSVQALWVEKKKKADPAGFFSGKEEQE